MRVEPVERWLGRTLEDAGISVPQAECAHYAARLEAAGALPGGAPPREVPPGLRALWSARDRGAAEHRAVYTGLAREVPLPWPGLYDALYERHTRPEAWQPYPDAAEVLAALRR